MGLIWSLHKHWQDTPFFAKRSAAEFAVFLTCTKDTSNALAKSSTSSSAFAFFIKLSICLKPTWLHIVESPSTKLHSTFKWRAWMFLPKKFKWRVECFYQRYSSDELLEDPSSKLTSWCYCRLNLWLLYFFLLFRIQQLECPKNMQ